MARLKLTLDSASNTLTSMGDIFSSPYRDGDRAQVSDVNASKLGDSFFHLHAGDYVYSFGMMNGSGEFTVAVSLRDTNATLGSKKFSGDDTSGLVFRFSVPEGGGE